jgi:hypothetical protein
MLPECRCGCPHEFHVHMHSRTYCGTCDCKSYRRPPGRFMAWVERWLG